MPRPTQERRTLNDRFVKTRKPGSRRVLYWDTDPKRLALAVAPSGHKSWKLIYGLHGKVRWYNIGDASAVGLSEARKKAKRLEGEIAQGRDPQADKRKAQAEKRAERLKGTFEDLAQRYVEERAKRRNKSWAHSAFLVKTYLFPRWAEMNFREITRRDVKVAFAKLTNENGPVLANQVLAAASAIFNWAIKEEVPGLVTNPCRGVERNKTESRERVLADTEVPAFWRGFDDAGLVASSALKMILLSGQRPGEVQRMRWEHLEIGRHRFTDANGRTIEAEGAWWSLPGRPDKALGWLGTKNEQSHRVWLPQAAVALLTELEDDEDRRKGFVFAGPHLRPIGTLDDAMRGLCQRLGIVKPDKVTPHDLRRTHGTTITSLGFSRDQMNRLQNHKEGGIASVYDRHGYADENRRIQEAVARKIVALVEAKPAEGKVVPLHP